MRTIQGGESSQKQPAKRSGRRGEIFMSAELPSSKVQRLQKSFLTIDMEEPESVAVWLEERRRHLFSKDLNIERSEAFHVIVGQGEGCGSRLIAVEQASTAGHDGLPVPSRGGVAGMQKRCKRSR